MVPTMRRLPTRAASEIAKAAFRMAMKLMVLLGTIFRNVSLRTPLSGPRAVHQKTTRVTTRAANMEARIPIVRVIANPLTVPEARQKRMMAVMRVVMLASKMAVKAFS